MNRMRNLQVLGLVVLTLAMVLPAQAVVIYDNGSPIGILGAFNATGAISLADDFELDSPETLTDVHFWVFATEGDPSLSVWDGTLSTTIAEDNGGMPGTPLAQVDLDLSNGDPIGFEPTGLVIPDVNLGGTLYDLAEYFVSFDLPDPLALDERTRYWITLISLGSGSDSLFVEFTDTVKFNTGIYLENGIFKGTLASDLAFQLTGVPLPASTPLVLIGLTGLAFLRRRRLSEKKSF